MDSLDRRDSFVGLGPGEAWAVGWGPASGFPEKLAGDVFQEDDSADIMVEETRKGLEGVDLACLCSGV